MHRLKEKKFSKEDMRIFFKAVSANNLILVKGYLNQGIDINSQDPDGWTALMGATLYHYIEMVKFLLDNGADPFIKSTEGKTALGIAYKMGYKIENAAIIKLIQDKITELKDKEAEQDSYFFT